MKKWKSQIDRIVKGVGLSKWKTKVEKDAPMYVRWYDGSLVGDLLFQTREQCMDVNARNYR